MPWVAIVERNRAGCGRNTNKTYKNVVASTRSIKDTAATFAANNPTHPWADGGYHEYIVDLTEQQAEAINDGTNPLFHDRRGNEPRWQNQNEGTGSAYAPGSFADPEDDQSAFTADVALADDRWIVRLYDDDPGTTGVHIGALDLDENVTAQTIYLKLFDETDTASTTNVQDALTEIAGKLMIFDFTSGVTTFDVKRDVAGQVAFPSSSQYRVIGPGGEKSVLFRIFGRSIQAR